MASTRTSVHELSIEKVVPGGHGVAFIEHAGQRRAVFVPQVAPGDVVRADVDFESKPARGRLLDVVSASRARVEPPCAVAATCGGCDFMHLTREAQMAGHERILRDSLPPELREHSIAAHAAPSSAGYRTRARLQVRAGKKLEVGFLGAASHDVVETPNCLVLSPELEAIRRQLPTWFRGAKGRGEVRLALGAFPRRSPVVDLGWKGDLPAAFFAALEAAIGKGNLAGARVLEEGATRPATLGDPTPWMVGADGLPLKLGTGGFGQASDEGNLLLGTYLRALLDEKPEAPDASFVELFAGAGNFTTLLAQRTSRLITVESDPAACEAARQNLAARQQKARIVTDDADAFALPRGIRLLVLDPPRTGARLATANITSSKPARVIYVSCDPPTLGRDLAALLAAGYQVSSIASFELFPQTSHVETVVALERAR